MPSPPLRSINEDPSAQGEVDYIGEDARSNVAASYDTPSFIPKQKRETVALSKSDLTLNETITITSKSRNASAPSSPKPDLTVNKTTTSSKPIPNTVTGSSTPERSQSTSPKLAAKSSATPKESSSRSSSKNSKTSMAAKDSHHQGTGLLAVEEIQSTGEGIPLSATPKRSTSSSSSKSSSRAGKQSRESNKRSKSGKLAANSPISSTTYKESSSRSSSKPSSAGKESVPAYKTTYSKTAEDSQHQGTIVEEIQSLGEGGIGIYDGSVKGVFHADPSSTKPHYVTGEYTDDAHGKCNHVCVKASSL